MSNRAIDSVEYWSKRLEKIKDPSADGHTGGTGRGSVGQALAWKINTLDALIKKYQINSVLEFGFADCLVSKTIDVDTYCGFDITDIFFDKKKDFKARNVTLNKCRLDSVQVSSVFDASLCIDVLFHILKHENDYLIKTLDNLYDYSKRFIIIGAHDSYVGNPWLCGWHVFNSPWRQYLEKKPIKLLEQLKSLDNPFFFVYEKL